MIMANKRTFPINYSSGLPVHRIGEAAQRSERKSKYEEASGSSLPRCNLIKTILVIRSIFPPLTRFEGVLCDD